MKPLVTTIAICCLLSAAAHADFIDLPVKWSQPNWDPTPFGWISDHTLHEVLADDFVCDDAAPIVAVRWWGNYGSPNVRPNAFVPFDISFHVSVADHPGSVPAGLIVLYREVLAQEAFVGYAQNGAAVYRYDARLPEAFDQYRYSQESPNEDELFIDICRPSGEAWSWQKSTSRNLDAFAYSLADHNGPWQSGLTVGDNTDLAFELMVPEPATMGLMGLGLMGLLARRRRDK